MKKIDFNTEWRFKEQGKSETQMITLPHDAMLAAKRDSKSEGGSAIGYFTGGIYIYEKTFFVPEEWKEKNTCFEFEGVYRKSRVYLNDKEAGGRPYGYSTFTVETEGFLEYGKENQIRVIVDNSELPNCRWYSGSGIYRPVSMIIGNKTHIEWNGVKITTISYNPAKILVESFTNGGEVSVEILEGENVVAKGTGKSTQLEIPNARLWSETTPELYTCRVTLTENGEVVDEVEETVGIRKVEWNNKGLFINGQQTLLRGGCIHHDNGVLGACGYAKAEERRIRIIKEAGFNSIRISHNPATKSMLSACDRYGIYVIDETFDQWYMHKNKYDYASDFDEWYLKDTKAMVDKDFNHPSVIMYSIGNEVSEPYEAKGIKVAKEMIEYIHGMDKNRAVTAGINLMLISSASKGKGIYKDAENGNSPLSDNGKKKKEKASGSTFFNMMAAVIGTGMNKAANSKAADLVTTPVLDALDIAGYNYASGRYKMEGKKHPNRVIVGSETFPQDIAKNWEMVKKYPYLIGDYMWTAWDYLGEAGIGGWAYDGTPMMKKPYPWLLADTGAIDILGNIGAESKYASTVWGLEEKPYIGVRPVNHPGVKVMKSVWRATNAISSWSWNGCEGNKAEIDVFADATTVELLVNGKSLGKKKIKEFKTGYKTKYTPGTLTAIAYDITGKEISRNELKSASSDLKIHIAPEDVRVKVGELVFIPIAITDKNNTVECNQDQKLRVTVLGGELLGFGSARPSTRESYLSNTFRTYYGRALAVVRANKIGSMEIKVHSEKLSETATIIVTD
jgi:hypothetical protein